MPIGCPRNSIVALRVTPEELEELNMLAAEYGIAVASLAYMLYRRGMSIERRVREPRLNDARPR